MAGLFSTTPHFRHLASPEYSHLNLMKVPLRRSTLQILKRLGNTNSVKKMLNIYILWTCKMSFVVFMEATTVKARGEKT